MIVLITMTAGTFEAEEPYHQLSKIAPACPKTLHEMTARKFTKQNIRKRDSVYEED
jgi:hypothetical protein